MRGSRTAAAAAVILGLGGALLFFGEAELVRVGAAVLLLVGIALGAFAIATPEFIGADED